MDLKNIFMKNWTNYFVMHHLYHMKGIVLLIVLLMCIFQHEMIEKKV